mmetsp:Transcript_24511/g.55935  ORF Transcript_24511/g.55935 Transcript_24511/m.55935 type:complete len:213 (-) Transcript_24511:644-1282(-)
METSMADDPEGSIRWVTLDMRTPIQDDPRVGWPRPARRSSYRAERRRWSTTFWSPTSTASRAMSRSPANSAMKSYIVPPNRSMSSSSSMTVSGPCSVVRSSLTSCISGRSHPVAAKHVSPGSLHSHPPGQLLSASHVSMAWSHDRPQKLFSLPSDTSSETSSSSSGWTRSAHAVKKKHEWSSPRADEQTSSSPVGQANGHSASAWGQVRPHQ